MSSYRRGIALLSTALVLALAPRGEAFQPQVVDAVGDAPTPSRDVTYALFETIDHPVDGPTLQLSLGLRQLPEVEESATYTVAFDHGDCGGGRVTYDWNGGGELAFGGTVTKASFWSCHTTATVGRESVYSYVSHEITVTWLSESLQFWVPLSSAGLRPGTALTNTRACTGQTVFGATTDIRRRTGIDCSADSSPTGTDYVVGS